MSSWWKWGRPFVRNRNSRPTRVLGICLMGLAWCLWGSPVMAGCSVSTTGVIFSAYDVFSSTPVESVGYVDVRCTQRSNVLVQLSLGPSAVSGGFIPRQMLKRSGTDRLNYNFYTKKNYRDVWGDGTGGSVIQTMKVFSKASWKATIFGLIPARQNVSAGTYGDSMVVSVIF